MTADEIVDFFAPDQVATDAVLEWLVSSGISADHLSISANKQVLIHPFLVISSYSNSNASI
jgi:hypothetical protein